MVMDYFLTEMGAEERRCGSKSDADDSSNSRSPTPDLQPPTPDFLLPHRRTYSSSPGSSAEPALPISYRSHALVNFHSRFTVGTETPSASAISSLPRPPKKRSSTIRV